MIVPMTRIEVLGSRRLLRRTLDLLQDAGVVHISEAPLQDAHGEIVLARPDAADGGPGHDELTALERLQERLKEMSVRTPADALVALDVRKEADRVRDELTAGTPADLEPQVNEFYETYREHDRALTRREGELQVARRYAPAFQALADLLAGAEGIEAGKEEEGVARRAVVLESSAAEVLAGLADMVDILTDATGRVYRAPVAGGRQAVLMVYPRRYDERVGRLLGEEGIEELQAPVAYRDLPLPEAAAAFRRRIAELPDEIADARTTLAAFLIREAPRIKGMLAQVTGRLEAALQTGKLAVSGRAFVLQGFVPRAEFEALNTRLADELEGRVVVTDLGIAHGEEDRVPTKLRNRGFFKDFEVMLALLPPAKYGTVDATPLIAIGFPLFFGLMLGDVLYGLLVIGMALALKYTLGRRIEMIRAGGTILLVSGLSTVFFGFFFGEFGGNLAIGLKYWIYDRHHDLNIALAVVLGIGWVHVQLGLLLSLLKHFRHRHIRHGLASAGFMLALGGLLLLVVQNQGAAAGLNTPMYGLLGLGIVLIVYGEGSLMNALMGLLHILSYAGNIFSYARLMAIGLASVMLAVVANSFVQTGSILGLIIGLFAALFFHTLNFALGVFGPSIHSLRLHYVEFFGKFYEPQGTAFRPFRKLGGEEV
jgi:V/A-type H+-transporting ATPase subunit I